MENILVLNGSPRGEKGNTNELIECFMQGYKSIKTNSQIEYIELKDKNINNCKGCFNCWSKTPGKCIYKDDMDELLEKYINSDLIIWATPLYHYGMTSIMKKFVERTLPINKPYIVKIENKFTHPERYDSIDRRNILISNCGFPEFHNFDVMLESFEKVTNNKLDESICCVMGELLSQKPLANRIKWYKDLVKKAGVEYATNNCFENKTKEKLKTPLVPIQDFIEMANLSWNAKGEIPPEIEKAMGNKNLENKIYKKGLSFLKLMKQSFSTKNSKGINAILEIEFKDLSETNHFIIKNQKCELIEGESNSYTTKIITTYNIWMKISNKEISGSKAMMEGLYQVKGDFDFMLEMERIFGGEEEETVDEKKLNIMGINLEKWMGILFIPWILSWVFISNNSLVGIWLPLLLGIGIVAIKNKYNEVTYFEKMSVIYFGFLSIMELLGFSLVIKNSIVLNYFAIALIWISSLLNKMPLTAEYSKHGYNNIENNIIFLITNKILTLFWSAIFILQGCIIIILIQNNLMKFAPLIYILIIIALKFTSGFSKWYPAYIAKGRLK